MVWELKMWGMVNISLYSHGSDRKSHVQEEYRLQQLKQHGDSRDVAGSCELDRTRAVIVKDPHAGKTAWSECRQVQPLCNCADWILPLLPSLPHLLLLMHVSVCAHLIELCILVSLAFCLHSVSRPSGQARTFFIKYLCMGYQHCATLYKFCLS